MMRVCFEFDKCKWDAVSASGGRTATPWSAWRFDIERCDAARSVAARRAHAVPVAEGGTTATDAVGVRAADSFTSNSLWQMADQSSHGPRSRPDGTISGRRFRAQSASSTVQSTPLGNAYRPQIPSRHQRPHRRPNRELRRRTLPHPSLAALHLNRVGVGPVAKNLAHVLKVLPVRSSK